MPLGVLEHVVHRVGDRPPPRFFCLELATSGSRDFISPRAAVVLGRDCSRPDPAGLFHPVETTYDLWDALDDTEKCTNENECEDDLGANLMFPWPVCDSSGCVSQNQLTPEQQGVMHRYSGVY